MTELAITASSPEVWLAIGQGLLFAAAALLFGTWASRIVGLLRSDAPAGETLGVGLASGLMVLAAWWAAIWSGGRSSFTPVAIGFGVAIALGVARRIRRRTTGHDGEAASARPGQDSSAAHRPQPRRTHLILTALAGAVFIVAISLFYGSTMAPSPRDGVQPVERIDLAFYAVLGADLATTGTETNTLPSGFSDLPGFPAQTWYHWGELWLASAIIKLLGASALAARYLMVLPVLLLAAAAMTGTVVRRLNGTASRPAFLFGFLACLVLAPIPLVPSGFFSVWAAGLVYGIIVFGLAAVAVLFGLYGLAVVGTRESSWPLAGFVGSAAALILPSHVVIALLALVGVGAVSAVRIADSLLSTHRLPEVPSVWRRTLLAAALALLATVAWGVVTGHSLGGSAPLAGVAPFNSVWSDSVAIVTLEAGLLLTIPIAWVMTRPNGSVLADVCLGTTAIVVGGAILWGWQLATFNAYYFFFAAIGVFATPVALASVWLIVARLRATRHPRLAMGAVVLCAIQLELGVVVSLARVQGGPDPTEPIPVSLLQVIDELPADAKLAYACRPFEEVSFVNSKFLGIDAHTGRRVVPMCFQADTIGPFYGTEPSSQVSDAGFALAPQAALYPTAAARPSSAEVAAFLKSHGIGYIYADARHPNTLVEDAVPIATSGSIQVLRVP